MPDEKSVLDLALESGPPSAPSAPPPGHLDLDAVRKAAARGPNGTGPLAARRRPAYSITGDAESAD